MILTVSERKIGKKNFLSKKNETLSKSVFLRQNTPKMTKKVVKLFFRRSLKKYFLVKWPCSMYLKGVFLVVLYVGKKIMVMGFVDQNIFPKNTPPPNTPVWGGVAASTHRWLDLARRDESICIYISRLPEVLITFGTSCTYFENLFWKCHKVRNIFAMKTNESRARNFFHRF